MADSLIPSVKINDVVGFGVIGARIVDAIEHGITGIMLPWQIRRTNDALIASAKRWQIASSGLNQTLNEVSVDLSVRTEARLKFEQQQYQMNREAIAVRAIDDIITRRPLVANSIPDEPIEYEWLEKFWRLAESIKDPDMQAVWGRVLSRKSTSAGEFSIRTLQALATLSKEEANALARLASFTITTDETDEVCRGLVVLASAHPDASNVTKPMYKLTEPIQKMSKPWCAEIFGPMGLYLTLGWSPSVRKTVENDEVSFKIAGQKAVLKGVTPAVMQSRFRQDKFDLANGYGWSPIGLEILSLIEATASPDFVELLTQMYAEEGLTMEMDR
jgi:hypothetical protein